MAEKRYANAAAFYGEAIRQDPELGPAYAKRAQAQIQLGEYREARQDLDKALELQPENRRWLEQRADVNLRLRDYDRAITDYTALIDAAEQPASVYLRRGEAFLGSGDAAAAVGDFDKSLQLKSEDPTALLLRGRANLMAGELPKAESDLTAAIEQWEKADEQDSRRLANAYWYRAIVRGRMEGKDDEAKQDRSRALALDPSLELPESSLGRSLLQDLRRDDGVSLDISTLNSDDQK